MNHFSPEETYQRTIPEAGELIIEETEDGSPTLYVPSLREHYHSTHGARTESMHIFIRHAFRERIALMAQGERAYAVLEIGFGTGLNALLTLMEAERMGVSVLYSTYELYPLSERVTRELWERTLAEEEWVLMQKLHQAKWDREVEISDHFRLFKHHEDLREATLPEADVIYMDAFAPEKSPELWSEAFVTKLSQAARDGAVLSTYCAKGAVRRRLEAAGFEVRRTPGPPGGKREILVAYRKK